MLFTTDSHFHIGKPHLTGASPCQDYTLSGMCDDAAYAIVADGCSSGGKTDVGARVLAHVTAKAVCRHWSTHRAIDVVQAPQEIDTFQQVLLSGVCDVLGLSTVDMLATCLLVYVSPQGGLVHLKGDGVVAVVSVDGRVHMTRYEWENNAPLYPVYALNDFVGFNDFHGGDVAAVKLVSESWDWFEGNFTRCDDTRTTLGDGIKGTTIPVDVHNSRYVAVFSDGVTQVKGMDWKDVIVALLHFKSKAGRFAARRMNRVLKDIALEGKEPLDDVGMAVVQIEQVEEVVP